MQGMHGQNVHADCASLSGFHRLEANKKDPTWSESADRWIIATLQWPNQSLLMTRFELIFTSLISSTYPPKVLQEKTAPLIILSVLQLPYQAYQAVPSFQVLPFVFHHLPIFSAPEIGANHHHHDRHAITLPSPANRFSGALGCFFCTVSKGTGPEACRVTELLREIGFTSSIPRLLYYSRHGVFIYVDTPQNYLPKCRYI